MKKLLLVLLVFILSGCSGMTTWVLSDDDSYSGRLGIVNENNVEIGATAVWENYDSYPQIFGA